MTEPNNPSPSEKPVDPRATSPESAGLTPAAPGGKAEPSSSKTGADVPAKKKEKAPKVKEPGRWRKRLVRAFMGIIVIGLAFQILLWSLLPWTLRRAAKFYDLDLTCDRPDLSLFNSDAGLWHVKVTQHGQPVANVDYCRADISILNLLRGKLIIQRLEADGVDLTVQRDADGSIPLLKGILFGGTPAAPAAKTPAGKPAPLDLRSPVAIDALVLTHVRTHLIDHAVKPELNTDVQMNLRLTDVGSIERPPKFSMQLIPTPLSTPLLDSVVVEAGSKKVSESQSIELYFSASARGLHPKLLEGYLAPFGVRVTAEGVAMSARGTLAVNVIANNTSAVTGAINLTKLAITADGRDAATMQSVAINIDSASPSSAALSKIELADGTFLAERTALGGLRVAGFEFTPGTATDTGTTPPPPTKSSTAPFLFSLGEFSLKNFRASFKDAGVTPAADLEFLINALSLKNLTTDSAKPDSAITITGDFAAPGIIHDVKIDGSCNALAAKKTFNLNVAAAGIHPDALGPYFAMMGIDSDLKSARFTCQLTADVSLPSENTIAANARLANVKFEDEQELLALDDVNLAGIGFSPGKVRIDAIDVTGPRAAARREKSGAIWAAGFRLKPTAPKSPDAKTIPAAVPRPDSAFVHATTTNPTTKPVATADTLAALPKIDIGRFSWTGVKLHLDDQAAPQGEATTLAIDDAGVELTGLHIDFDPKAPAAANPAHLRAYLKAPGMAGDVKLDGTIAQHPGGLVADLEVTGKELSAILVGPYLKALNVEPTLRDGSIHARAHVDIAQLDDGIAATVAATDFQFSDPTGELLGADEAGISGIHLTSDTLEIGEVSLKKPRGQFAREEGGAISALGFRLLPVPPTPKKSAFAAAPLAPGAGAPTLVPTTQPAADVPTTQPATGPQIIVLKKFSLTDAAFAWTDRAVKPTAQILAHVDGAIDGVTWGKPADPAKINFTLKADGIVDAAKIVGTLQATAQSAGAKLDISAEGLKQGALASYLPPGMTIELKDGRFKTHVDLDAGLNPKGGAGGALVVSGLDYRDGTDGPTLFSLDSVKVSVPRVDIPAGVIDVDEISVTGVQASARMAKDGTIHAMGIVLAPATQPSATTQPAVTLNNAPAATTMPAVSPDAPDRLASSAPLVVVKPKYPLISLTKLDLNLKHFTLTDETRENVPPIAISDLHFVANKPISALGKDAATRPATDFGLSMKIDDMIDSLVVKLQTAPFAGEPTLSIDVTGTGIHGDGLLAQVPALKPQIDASHLTDGRLHAHVFAKVKMDRFDPLEFPLDRAFDVDAVVKGVEFRSDEKGPVLIGVDEIRSEGIHVHPSDKTVIVKTLEVENIVGQATREKDGIHALGVVLKLPQEPATQPTTAPTKTPEKPAEPKPPVVVATTAPSTPDTSGEIRVNKIFVSGLDFRITDNTVSPPLLVPLNQLDLDVRNISSKEFTEVRPPTRFSLLVGAGKVPLPVKAPKNAAAAAPPSLADIGAKLGGKKTPKIEKSETGVPMEDRDLFSQVQADGELVFFPQPKGWLKASVSAFDLAEMSSTVKPMKVDLANGVFDAAIDARLPGDGSLVSDSHFIFTDLDLSEPANGPIQQHLKLTAPTNIVIGVLERPDGSIDVPLSITVEKGKLTTGEIAGAAIHAFGVIAGNAVAAAPVKIANAAGDIVNSVIPFSSIFGLNKPKNNGPFTITFSAGDDGLTFQDQEQLHILVERMKEEPDLEATVRSDLSGGPEAGSGDLNAMTGDIGRARARANPSQEECRELINRLSRRKDDLIRRRLDVLGQARGDVASRSSAESASSIERLRAVERELSATEDALDRLYDLERPGANRQAGRRTKQSALAVARSREQAITDYLSAAGLADLKNRVNTPRPTFAPTPSGPYDGGSVVITLTVKRKS